MPSGRQRRDAESWPLVQPHDHLARLLSMRKRFGCVIPQPGGDRNPRVTVDHKRVVRVVDDARKFHLQNSIELLNDWTDFKLVPAYSLSSADFAWQILRKSS